GERVAQRWPVAARRRGDLDRRFSRCLDPRGLPRFESASTTAQPYCARDSGDDDADRRKQGATRGIEVVVMVIVSKQDGVDRWEEDAELRLRLDGRKPHRQRLAIRAVREDQERPEEVPPLREDRENRDDSEDRLREGQHDREEET